MNLKYFFTICIALCTLNLTAQVLPDTLFNPQLTNPAFLDKNGPTIHIDAAHNNYHTASERFAPFARVLLNDGYRVSENFDKLLDENLDKIKLLVISNALNKANDGNWSNPCPSAFSDDEINSINSWVKNGGRLMLIADHMPFSGAAQKLAASFGFAMCNCFAMDNRRRNPEIFFRSNATLYENEITNGQSATQKVDSIATFTGSAFTIPPEAIPIIKLKDYTILTPDQAWRFTDETPFENSEHYFQAAALNYGKGKLILMGEAAMFTAQIAGNQKVGMNSESAKNNVRLLRNAIQWLLK